MPDKKTRGISNLPVAIPDIPDAPTVSAVNVGTARAYNDGSATVTITSATGGRPSSYSIATTPITTTTTATSSPATITGLASATSYTTTVTPTNVSATGAATTSSAFTATTVPQAPTIGTFTDGGTGTTGTLSFTAGATGGSSITGYTYSTDGTNYSAASGTTSPFSLTGLTVGTTTYYLKATNANGTSLASTGVSGTVIDPAAFVSIATTTVGSGGSSTITFSSIPATYTHLQIRGFAQASTTTETFNPVYCRLNSDTTNANYYHHRLQGGGSSAASSNEQFPIIGQIQDKFNSKQTYSGLVVDVLDYANTNKYKTIRSLYGGDVNGTGGIVGLSSTLWMNTTAITSITLTLAGGSSPIYTQYSQFALYGIKGS